MRTGERTATNLLDMLAALAASLLADGMAIVLDGFSRPNDYASNPDYDKPVIERSIAREQGFVAALRMEIERLIGADALPRVHDAIGCDLLESIFLASQCHAYFVHHGTLQHKIGYFTKVPGMAHANPGILQIDPAGTHRHVTEDPGVIEYVDAALIEAVPVADAQGPLDPRNSYRFTDIARMVSVFRDFMARHTDQATRL